MRTFERVTGPKTDKWLVKTAVVVINALGGALTLSGGAPPSRPGNRTARRNERRRTDSYRRRRHDERSNSSISLQASLSAPAFSPMPFSAHRYCWRIQEMSLSDLSSGGVNSIGIG